MGEPGATALANTHHHLPHVRPKVAARQHLGVHQWSTMVQALPDSRRHHVLLHRQVNARHAPCHLGLPRPNRLPPVQRKNACQYPASIPQRPLLTVTPPKYCPPECPPACSPPRDLPAANSFQSLGRLKRAQQAGLQACSLPRAPDYGKGKAPLPQYPTTADDEEVPPGRTEPSAFHLRSCAPLWHNLRTDTRTPIRNKEKSTPVPKTPVNTARRYLDTNARTSEAARNRPRYALGCDSGLTAWTKSR